MTKNWFEDNRDGGLIDEISFSFKNQDGKKTGGLSDLLGEKRDDGISRQLLPEDFCPYLGSRDDRATRLGYPSQWNHCYRHEKSAPLTIDAQTKYCLTREFESCVIYQQEEPEEVPFFALAWINSARLWAKEARSKSGTMRPQTDNTVLLTDIALQQSENSRLQTEDAPQQIESAPRWAKKARPLAVIVPVLLIIIAALVWWPMPGTSVEESTGNAAPLQEIVQPEENVRPDRDAQPALSRRFEGQKEPAIPAEDGIDSEAESEAPAAETEETDEKGSGGFRVRIYE